MSKHAMNFRLVLTAVEKAALERLAERDGVSQASFIRRLVRREAQQAALWLDEAALSAAAQSDAAQSDRCACPPRASGRGARPAGGGRMSSDNAPSTPEQLLSPAHLRMLREESAITDEVILARGYRTVTDQTELRDLGFAPAQRCTPALVLPVWTTDGGRGAPMIRPDAPRSFDKKDKPKLPDGTYPQEVLKYEQPKGAALRLDCPPPCRPQVGRPDRPAVYHRGHQEGGRAGLPRLLRHRADRRGVGLPRQELPGRPDRAGRLGDCRAEGPRRAHRLRFRRHAQARGAERAQAHHRVPAEPRRPRDRDLPAARRARQEAGRGRLLRRRAHGRGPGGAGRGPAAPAAAGRRHRGAAGRGAGRHPPAADPAGRPGACRNLAERAHHADRDRQQGRRDHPPGPARGDHREAPVHRARRRPDLRPGRRCRPGRPGRGGATA